MLPAIASLATLPALTFGPCSFTPISSDIGVLFLFSEVSTALGYEKGDHLLSEWRGVPIRATGALLTAIKGLFPPKTLARKAASALLIPEPALYHMIMSARGPAANAANHAIAKLLSAQRPHLVEQFFGEGRHLQAHGQSDRNRGALRMAGSFEFQGQDIFFIEVEGRAATTMGGVARALDYASPDEVGRLLARHDDEVAEGVDYVMLRGEPLAAFKAMAPNQVEPTAPTLRLMFESGLHLLAMLSRQPKAAAFRRWLVSEVLPAIQTTGSYSLPGATTDLAPMQQSLDAMAGQLRELQGTLDALLLVGDRFSVADALALIFERWYIWKANVPVTAAELCDWALPQGDVRNAFERVLPRSPQAINALNPTALKKWLTGAASMEVQVRMAPRVTRLELRMGHGPCFWLRVA